MKGAKASAVSSAERIQGAQGKTCNHLEIYKSRIKQQFASMLHFFDFSDFSLIVLNRV